MAPGLLITPSAPSVKKRLAPQPPKPVRSVLNHVIKCNNTNKVDDSYSTMSTVSIDSASSPNSTVSEKSTKVKLIRKPLPRTTLPKEKISKQLPVENIQPITGWIRVYCGPAGGEEESNESSSFLGDANKLVQINCSDRVTEIVQKMNLPMQYTMWLQVDGMRTRRLQDTECPLVIQECFLKKLGYLNVARRQRMGIDPELKHILRFHMGPVQIDCCRGVARSGQIEVLKGLVSPQWKLRSMCVLGSRLVIFPGKQT